MRSELILVGGGGHAAVVRETAMASGRSVIGYFDDNEDCALRAIAVRRSDRGKDYWSKDRLEHLGPFRDFLKADIKHEHIIAIGCLATRRQLIDLYSGELGTVIHPAAITSPMADIRRGTFVAASAIVNPFAELGLNTIINTRAVVEHHCHVGENCHVAPGAILGGGVYIGANTLIGISACVKPNVRVGNNCVVGAGAVVTNDVADGATVVGVPAKPVGRIKKKAA